MSAPRKLYTLLLQRENLTTNGLANKLGGRVDQSQLNRFETGVTREPRQSTLKPVADYFGIPVATFYSGYLAEAAIRALEGTGRWPNPEHASDMQLLNRAIARDGNASRLAERLDLAPHSISNWKARGLPRAYAMLFRLEEQTPQAAPAATHAWNAVSAFMAAMPPVGTVLTAEARDAALLKFIKGSQA